jgi:IS1 family transposase
MSSHPKKNTKMLGLAWDREAKRCLGVQLSNRNIATGQKLWKQLSLFEIDKVCSDYYPVYTAIVDHPI